MRKFDESKAKRSNGIAEVIKLNRQSKLFDFLPSILKIKSDLEIMDRWISWFELKKVSFAITDEGNYFTLWKEKYI